MRLSAAILLTLLVLGGCEGKWGYAESKKWDRLREYEGQDFGYVVVSVGKEKSATYVSTFVSLLETRTGAPGAFLYAPKALFNDANRRDFDTPDGEGTVILRKLPPGTYEIQTSGAARTAGAPAFIPQVRDFYPPIRFTVVPGKVSYLGRFIIGQDGYGPIANSTIKISSEESADIAMVKLRETKVTLGDVRSYVPEPGTYSKP
jgi:hypothetical protein